MSLIKPSQKTLLAKIIGLLNLGAAVVGPPVFAGPHDPVASDGSVVVVVDGARESAGDTAASRPYRGTGQLTGTEGVSLVAPNVQELRTLPALNLPVPGERKATEAIIGFDTRVRTYTLSFPATAVALVTFENARCTGWFIGPDTVATAGIASTREGAAATGMTSTPIRSIRASTGSRLRSAPAGQGRSIP